MGQGRLYNRVAEQIAQLINDGVFPKGTRLPGERELASRFEVSRVTIREAEISLQARGLIEIKTGSGVYVCEEFNQKLDKFPDVSAFEVTEARSLIESEACALAAKVISDENIQKLEELVLIMGGTDKEASLAADREFHATIAQASGNVALIYSIENLWRMREELPDVKRNYDAICRQDPEALAAEHRGILDTLKARDPEAARRSMREHFLRLIGTLLDATEQEALKAVQQRAIESRERFLGVARMG